MPLGAADRHVGSRVMCRNGYSVYTVIEVKVAASAGNITYAEDIYVGSYAI